MAMVFVTTLVSAPPPTVTVTTDVAVGVVFGGASTVTSEVIAPVSAFVKELREATMDEEISGASVTGHTVVVTPICVVMITVDTPSGSEVGSEVTAPVPEAVGQFVTVAAHEMLVIIEVMGTVIVVKLAPGAVVVVFA